GDVTQHVAPTAIRADGQAAADDLAQACEIGPHAVQLLRASERDAKAGDDLVEDQQRTVLRSDLAQASEESRRGSHHTHVARHRLDDQCRDLRAARREQLAHRGQIVERQRERQRREYAGHAATVGNAERGAAGAGLDEQAIGMAVIAAVEFHEHVAPVAPRATRMALMAASVPEDTSRTISIEGY